MSYPVQQGIHSIITKMVTRSKYERALAEANKAFAEVEEVQTNPELIAVIVAFSAVALIVLLIF